MPAATIISRHSLLWAQQNNSISARLVNLGTWNVVRVGMLWSLRQDVFQADIDPNFAFGLCSGTTNCYGDATVTHFVGITSEIGAFGLPWQETAGGFLRAVMRPSKKVGATQSNGTNLATNHLVYANTVVDNKRSITWIEFTKGSPNYSFKIFYRDTDAATDATVTDLEDTMEDLTPTLANHTFSAAQTLAVDEGVDGTLNAIQVYWPLTTTSAEIDAVRVFKIS